MAKAGRGADQFVLRLPDGMRNQIKRAAEDSGRSMNSEILDVLREAFPGDPGIEELVDALDYSIAILRDIQAQSPSNEVTRNNKFMSVLGRLEATNEELWKTVREDRSSPVVVLRRDVLAGMEALLAQYELPKVMIESLASDLIQMSLNRIASGEEKLKAWIGEGEAQRMIELETPSVRSNDK